MPFPSYAISTTKLVNISLSFVFLPVRLGVAVVVVAAVSVVIVEVVVAAAAVVVLRHIAPPFLTLGRKWKSQGGDGRRYLQGGWAGQRSGSWELRWGS